MANALQVTRAASTVVTTSVSKDGLYAPVRGMKLGATGAEVTRLQTALKQLGFDPGAVKGTFNAATEKALKAFQLANGVKDHGLYGPKTEAALAKALGQRAGKTGPAMSLGARGEAVTQLQNALKERGFYKGVASGTFDAATQRAVRAFEKSEGKKVDGIVNRAVWKELGGATRGSGPRLKAGQSGESVAVLQRRLKTLGFYSGKTDGKFDAATKDAVKRFEEKAGLKADGFVGAKVWDSLGTHVLTKDEVGGPNLRAGQRGSAVRILEQKLKARGLFEGKADGKFDAATKQAVMRFEKRNDWKADGVVGNGVWRALGGAGMGSGPVLKKGAEGPEVRVLQRRLKAKGVYDGAIDGAFGPMTESAVKAYERKIGAKTVDGIVGNGIWRQLGTHVVANPQAKPAAMPEPKHDYRRVSVDGEVISVRTNVMFKRAFEFAKAMGVKKPFTIVQGSYSTSVSASGGTHDGGGAIDLRTWDHSRSDVVKMVKALRMAGFAAWKRGYGGDSFDPHIHMIAIGDRELSSSARNQVAEYFRGGDGLVGSAPDGDRSVGRPYPNWARKYR